MEPNISPITLSIYVVGTFMKINSFGQPGPYYNDKLPAGSQLRLVRNSTIRPLDKDNGTIQNIYIYIYIIFCK
jgi:hypothetical protein